MTIKVIVKVNAQAQAGMSILSSTSVQNVTLEYMATRRRVFAYINDDIQAANMIGFVQSLSNEDGDPLAADSLQDIIAKGYKAMTTGANIDTKEIYVDVIPEEKATKKTVTLNASADIEAAMKSIIDNNIMSEAEVKERLSYMKDPEYVRIPFADELILNVFKYIYNKGKQDGVRIPRTLYKDNYSFVDEYKEVSIVAICTNKILCGHHVIFQGDKSVGKTVMVETISWLLNKPIQRAQANERMTADHLFGAKTTAKAEIMDFSKEESQRLALLSLKASRGDDLTDAELAEAAMWNAASARSQAPMIIEEDGPLKLALKNGCVFNLEEANLLNPNTMGVLNNCNDGSKFVQTASGVIEIASGYVFIGTQNTGKAYVGTNKQNAASMSRIDFVVFPYNKDIKKILIEAVSDQTRDRLTDGYFTQVNKFYCEVKTMFENGAVSDTAMNIRGMIRALNEVASVNIGGKTFKPMTSLQQALRTCVIEANEEDAKNQSLIRCLQAVTL